MKSPTDGIIARSKLTDYLLRPLEKDDKSGYLAAAGFTQENPDALENAIRAATASGEAMMDRHDRFGMFYRIRANLKGPAGVIPVVIIWMCRNDGVYSFVTLYPDKEQTP
jgi:hypothetical protein